MKCRVLECGECYITQHYGNDGHSGVDLVANIGGEHETDYVVAHSEGTVIAIATGHKNEPGATGMASYGNYVQIQHDDGYTTFYAHLKTVSVSKGQRVSRGQRLGYMGNTGNAYGAHLHWELRRNTTYASRINPEPYLDSDLPQTIDKTVSYRVYCNGHWFDTTRDGGRAGNSRNSITGIQMKTGKGCGTTKYRVHLKGGEWLPEVYKWDDTDDGYAGIKGRVIDAFTCWSEHGDMMYRAQTKECGWLPWIRGNYGIENDYDFAGNIGQDIIAIEIKVV